MKALSITSKTIAVAMLATGAFAQSNYSEDLSFIERYDNPVVLKSSDGRDQIVVSPKYQGRVLTSTAEGDTGNSNGWLDYNALENGNGSPGGEERIWLAPIGSKFSLYYGVGMDIAEENWAVPAVISTIPYPIQKQDKSSVTFHKELQVQNNQKTNFKITIDRTVTLYSNSETASLLELKIPDNLSTIGYGSENTLTNTGEDWKAENGLLSPWIMGMFQGTDKCVSVFPTKSDSEIETGINTYLYPLEDDRLKVDENAVLYKTDGRYRSKIGVPAHLSKDVIGSYTPEVNRLTIIKFTFENAEAYPISYTGDVDDSKHGDVTNSYNHGNMDGSLFEDASFYELESAGAMKELKHGESITHVHQTFHFFGSPEELEPISQKVLGVSMHTLTSAF